ncbi:MAG: hypothetical protein QM774_03135 [Gordonia sp. (in: high G+C Gram-positive bacteria)]|uniref:hypothetical protein n=1 Tax=Gordonia sp. (in: high G+C Gram-positive bacteria) TaxID=84139 RepID=UPI0039E2F1D9
MSCSRVVQAAAPWQQGFHPSRPPKLAESADVTSPHASPDARPAPSRRTVLRAGAGLTVAAATVGAVSACSTGPSQREQDARALLPLAQTAARQQKQAEYLAPRQTDYTSVLKQVAAERGDHLTALTDEINRLHAPVAQEITTSPGESTTTLEKLRTDLQSAAKEAGDVATDADGYRAGLTGSIAASCAALREVALA